DLARVARGSPARRHRRRERLHGQGRVRSGRAAGDDSRAGDLVKIRVLVVDDSATVRGRLREILDAEHDFEVIGGARDGVGPVGLCAELRPDVMTLDLVLPGLTGLQVPEHVMAHVPLPILIVSSSFNRGEVFDTYEALAAGAVDVLDKTGTSEPDD